MAHVTTNDGVKLVYQEAGQGIPIVMISYGKERPVALCDDNPGAPALERKGQPL